MPIGGVLFADRARALRDRGRHRLRRAVVETDLTVESLGADGLAAVLGQMARDVPAANQ
jgi:hypothetical protein